MLLTREQVLAMKPGKALDCFVAEHVMGWAYKGENYDDARFRAEDGEHIGVPGDYDHVPSKASWFNPSRGIEAAMMVLCHARAGQPFAIHGWDGGYTCAVGVEAAQPEPFAKADGDTISEAICKAALLKAIRVKQ